MITRFSSITGIPESDILGGRRSPNIADARHVYWWLLRHAGYSLMEIARMNGRTHATVLHGISRVCSGLEVKDKQITELVSKTEQLKRESMSKLSGTVTLMPPTNTPFAETLTIGDIRCEACNGQGGQHVDERSHIYDPAVGEHYEACRVCRGTGKLRAIVDIQWKPDGQVKAIYR